MLGPASFESEWYKTERNTASLIKLVVADPDLKNLSGEDIWALLKLTWITKSKSGDHWRKLKVPALARLFKKKGLVLSDLRLSIEEMDLRVPVRDAAERTTGFVNAYTAYRNSLKNWCKQNAGHLRSILEEARNLGADDQERLNLVAKLVSELPRVPTPNEKRSKSASDFITPLVACLDPRSRFPIINGERGVNQRLVKLGLAKSSLEVQAQGFIGLIGQYGLRDAFAVDTMTEKQIEEIADRRNLPKPRTTLLPVRGKGAPLPILDEAEREAVRKSATTTYRKRHNKMTNRLRELLLGFKYDQGGSPECRYDVLVSDYNRNGRDLLIEAKSDADSGSIRIAIGQLLDYRRFLPNQAATDLAILTISRPAKSYIALMLDLQITALWFEDLECTSLLGEGKAWWTLRGNLKTTGGYHPS